MLNLVTNALNQVDERNYTVVNPTERNGYALNYSRSETDPEQAFASDLLSNVRFGFRDIENLRESGLYVTCELYKRTEPRFNNLSYIESFISLLNQDGVQPDILIHEGQHINGPESQLLAGEVKTKRGLTQSEFNKDMFKMFFYVKDLNFQNAFFVIVNNSVEIIEGLYENYKNHHYHESNEKIKIIVKESYESAVNVINCD